jgi:hypothetical protein
LGRLDIVMLVYVDHVVDMCNKMLGKDSPARWDATLFVNVLL